MLALTFLFKKIAQHRELLDYEPELLDTATSNTMAGAYVVLGFVLVLAMSTVADLENGVSEEATTIKSLERLFVLDGSGPALNSREHLLKYTKSILVDEWPLLPLGHGSIKSSAELNELYASLEKINPKDDKAEIIFSKILDQSARVGELRNKRNFSIESTLPQVFYVVSLLSVLAVVVICAMRLMKGSVIRVVVLSIQVIMLTLIFSAILIIDLPHLGDTRTSAEPILKAYDSMSARKL